MKGQPGKQALSFMDMEVSDNKELGYYNMQSSDSQHTSRFVSQSKDGDKVTGMVGFGFFGLENALDVIHTIS